MSQNAAPLIFTTFVELEADAIIHDTACYTVNVLPMRSIELFTHNGVEAVPLSFVGLLISSLHCACHSWSSMYIGWRSRER